MSDVTFHFGSEKSTIDELTSLWSNKTWNLTQNEKQRIEIFTFFYFH